jgi:hypothetical protein
MEAGDLMIKGIKGEKDDQAWNMGIAEAWYLEVLGVPALRTMTRKEQ